MTVLAGVDVDDAVAVAGAGRVAPVGGGGAEIISGRGRNFSERCGNVQERVRRRRRRVRQKTRIDG